MNIVLCTVHGEENAFFYHNLQRMLEQQGVESVIFSFKTLEDVSEYITVSPDVPDLLVYSSANISEQLEKITLLSDAYPSMQFVLIGTEPVSAEQLFAMGITYFFYLPVASESFAAFERRMMKNWFADREKYFIVENKKNTLRIAYSDILYVMSDKRKVIIYQPQGREDSLYCKLDEMEKSLDDRFIRCHQSYLVNVHYIRGIDVENFYLVDNVYIPISQKKYWAAKRKYIGYIKAKG